MGMGGDGTPLGDSRLVGMSWNANDLQNVRKRREMIEVFKKRGMDVLGVQETHMRGSGVLECKMGGECGVWEGMEGGSGVEWNEGRKCHSGRGKEGCALLMSEQMWRGLEDCGWKGTRIV